jgi:hypothetical protein
LLEHKDNIQNLVLFLYISSEKEIDTTTLFIIALRRIYLGINLVAEKYKVLLNQIKPK